MPGDSRVWAEIKQLGGELAALARRLDEGLARLAALAPPPADMATDVGHALLIGTLTRGTITSPQSCDAYLYRKTATGWELTDKIVKIYDNGFLPLSSITDVPVRYCLVGRERYYDGGGCPT